MEYRAPQAQLLGASLDLNPALQLTIGALFLLGVTKFTNSSLLKLTNSLLLFHITIVTIFGNYEH